MTKFDKKVSNFGARYGLRYEYQQLKYGFSRVIVTPENKDHHAAIVKVAKRLKSVTVTEWIAPSSIWEGIIYLMDADDYQTLIEKVAFAKKCADAFWIARRVLMQAGKTQQEATRLEDAIFGTREN